MNLYEPTAVTTSLCRRCIGRVPGPSDRRVRAELGTIRERSGTMPREAGIRSLAGRNADAPRDAFTFWWDRSQPRPAVANPVLDLR